MGDGKVQVKGANNVQPICFSKGHFVDEEKGILADCAPITKCDIRTKGKNTQCETKNFLSLLQCKRARLVLENKFKLDKGHDGTYSSDQLPRGCFRNVDSGEWIYNAHETGAPDVEATPVCLSPAHHSSKDGAFSSHSKVGATSKTEEGCGGTAGTCTFL